jgi:tyrosyl-tRNA synthetase
MALHSQNPEVFVVVDLLPGTTGTRDEEGRLKKMSKSSKNYIRMTETPAEMYGKTMSIPDDVMWVWFRELTEISSEQLSMLQQYVEQGQLHPMEVKKMLARLVVGTFNFKDISLIAEAEAAFSEKFGKEKSVLPRDIVAVEVQAGRRIIDVLSEISGESKATLRKMQGGVSILTDEEYRVLSVEELNTITLEEQEMIVKLGKRRYYRFFTKE